MIPNQRMTILINQIMTILITTVKQGQCGFLKQAILSQFLPHSWFKASYSLVQKQQPIIIISVVKKKKRSNKIPSPQLFTDSRCELCPIGWKLHYGRCYFYSETRDTWENSRKYCSGKKSELLIIEDETEMVSL